MSFMIPRPLITKEHGSWAVLFVPMAIALGRTRTLNLEGLLLVVSVLGGFLSYLPAQILLRHYLSVDQGPARVFSAFVWGIVFLFLGSVPLTYLVLHGYALLILFAGMALLLFLFNFVLVQRFGKSLWTDLVAVAGLTLGAPSAYYVGAGSFDREAVSLYLLSFLFFGCSVFYVHMKIRLAERGNLGLSLNERISIGKVNLLYHVAVLAVITVLSLWHWTPMLVVVAYAPMTIHAIYGTLRAAETVRFRRLGVLLLAHSFLFALILIFLLEM